MSTSTRYVGTCPVCAGRFKVRSGNLVHHGYERPGYGFIVGDCFAVGLQPHETSPETARMYGNELKVMLAGREKSLAHVEKADKLSYEYREYVGFNQPYKVCTTFVNRGDQIRYEGTNQIPSFDSVRKSSIRMLESEIEAIKKEIARMDGLVSTWTLQPLTTVEEEILRIGSEKLAARQAKKAESDAKKAEQARRKAERDGKLRAKIDTATTRARALLDAADPTNHRAVWQAYLKVLEIKLPAAVHQWEFCEKYLGRTELLRNAGLVVAHNDRLMTYEWQVRELFGKPR